MIDKKFASNSDGIPVYISVSENFAFGALS
jgi:hypothetical protein